MMRIRNILLCALAFTVAGSVSAGANELLQTWTGKTVRLTINGQEVPGGAIQIDGKAYVPVRAIAESTHAMLKSEPHALHIYKPNVHLLLFTTDKNGVKLLSGKLLQGKYEIYVMAQVDNLTTEIDSLRTAIIDPNGKTVVVQEEQKPTNENLFWYTSKAINMDFAAAGQYKVRLYIKRTADSEFELTAEKAIVVVKP